MMIHWFRYKKKLEISINHFLSSRQCVLLQGFFNGHRRICRQTDYRIFVRPGAPITKAGLVRSKGTRSAADNRSSYYLVALE